LLKIKMTHTVLLVQGKYVDSGELIIAHDFNGVVAVISEFRIAMIVGP